MAEQDVPCPSHSLPNSGAVSEFQTGARRDSNTGKGLPSRIPPAALRRLARRFEAGEPKYGEWNWRKGMPISNLADSAIRHLWSAMEGDASEDHLAAALWNVVVWIDTSERIERGELPAELDNLPWKG